MVNKRPEWANWLGGTNDITKLFLSASQTPDLINLAGGLPDPSVYPATALGQIAEQCIGQYQEIALGYGPIEGLPALRDFIADRFSTPSLQLASDNVLITTSGMQGLDLIGKVLVDHQQTIAVQSPAYLGALDAWRPRNPVLAPMHPDESGFDAVRSLANKQFAYAVPNFSNPTGKLIAIEVREQLVAAAHKTGTWLVEDDPYGALYYDSPPLPGLFTLSADRESGRYQGPVIYLGTLSKQLVPGLRVGWVIADAALISALTIAKQGSDLCTSGLAQLIALEALRQRLDKKQLPRMLSLYRARRDALCDSMSTHLSEWFSWEVPVGGMFVWVRAKDSRLNTDALLPHAMQSGVCFSPGSVFDPLGQDHQSMRLNFTFNSANQLQTGVKRLANAVRSMIAG